MDDLTTYLETFFSFLVVGGGLGIGLGFGYYLVDRLSGDAKRRKETVCREIERQELLKRSLKVQETMAATQARNSVSLP